MLLDRWRIRPAGVVLVLGACLAFGFAFLASGMRANHPSLAPASESSGEGSSDRAQLKSASNPGDVSVHAQVSGVRIPAMESLASGRSSRRIEVRVFDAEEQPIAGIELLLWRRVKLRGNVHVLPVSESLPRSDRNGVVQVRVPRPYAVNACFVRPKNVLLAESVAELSDAFDHLGNKTPVSLALPKTIEVTIDHSSELAGHDGPFALEWIGTGTSTAMRRTNSSGKETFEDVPESLRYRYFITDAKGNLVKFGSGGPTESSSAGGFLSSAGVPSETYPFEDFRALEPHQDSGDPNTLKRSHAPAKAAAGGYQEIDRDRR